MSGKGEGDSGSIAALLHPSETQTLKRCRTCAHVSCGQTFAVGLVLVKGRADLPRGRVHGFVLG